MNEADHNCGTNRREFMRDGFRYALLTGLAAVCATLFQRSGGRLTGQKCINQGVCRGCSAFTDCGLPQALSAKAFNSRGSRRESAQSSRQESGVYAASTSQGQIASKRLEARAPKAA
jgi:hypothetical protein